MAKLDSDILFTGSLGNLSAYKRHDSDKIILRRKGGASREMIKNSPAFQNVRRGNSEFGGRATASSWIMKMLWPQKALADYNIAGSINSLLKPIQLLDSSSEWGQRHVQLSKNPQLLTGFSLNEKSSFDSVLRASVTVSLSREERTARIEIPALLPRINFFPASQSFYSLQVVLGIVPDVFYSNGKYQPSSPLYAVSDFAMTETPWHLTMEPSEAVTLEAVISKTPPDDNFTLMLSIGIKYGATRNGGIQQVTRAGSAKVLAMS